MDLKQASLLLSMGDFEDYAGFKIEGYWVWCGSCIKGSVCGEKHGGIHAFSSDGIHWDLKKGECPYRI